MGRNRLIPLEAQITSLDPWLKKPHDAAKAQDAFERARFICAYDVWVGIDAVDEAAFLLRTPEEDQLWLASTSGQDLRLLKECGAVTPSWLAERTREAHGSAGSALPDSDVTGFQLSGPVVVAQRSGEEARAAELLLAVLFRARVLYSGPTKLVAGGLIDAGIFGRLVRELLRELKNNTSRARRRKAEIVRVARELRLSPEPAGSSPDTWFARCPGTGHRLAISAASNTFGCGYCRRKGGPDELRQFARDRGAGRASPG